MIETKITRYFNTTHPIISAPMAFAAGGKLAAAVSNAGGLGLIGGAYGDSRWISSQFSEAGNAKVGCGFITWNLDKALQSNPDLLERVLEKKPAALFLSFGNPEAYIETIRKTDVPIIMQVQTLNDAKHALDLGVDVLVAQGSEAGGHGQSRSTMTLVPEVGDLISRQSSNTILCAAGGIADGRGLAAALMLGAEGVVVGSRLWASEEAQVHPNMVGAAISATGDDTIRSSVMDIARNLNWPERYTARVLKNAFTQKWHNNISELLANAVLESDRWKKAWDSGDVETANTFVGEATGLITDVQPAEEIVLGMIAEAEGCLSRL